MTLIVEVQNLNDNVPMFITGVPGVPTANVTEEQAPGVEVYEIMVSLSFSVLKLLCSSLYTQCKSSCIYSGGGSRRRS